MKKLLNFRLSKIFLACFFFSLCLASTSASFAATASGYRTRDERNCRNIDSMRADLDRIQNLYISNVSNKQEIEQQRQKVVQEYQKIIETCEEILKSFPKTMNELNTKPKEKHWYGDDEYTDEEYQGLFKKTMTNLMNNANNQNSKDTAKRLYDAYNQHNTSIDQEYKKLFDDYDATGGQKCGDDYPFGCPSGTKCYVCGGGAGGMGGTSTSWSNAQCSKKDPSSSWTGNSCHQVETAGNFSSSVNAMGGLAGANSVTTDADGSKTETHENFKGDKEIKTTDLIGEYDADNLRSNAACHISDLSDKYMKNCYSCVIVSALINTFMTVAEKSQGLMQAAGLKLLVIGMFLWIAFFVLQKLSSLSAIDPMEMLQELFKFFFKCVVAFMFITSGLRIIAYYFVNPLLSAGADYGIAVIDTVMPKSVSIDGKTKDYSDEMNSKAMKLNAEAALDKKIFSKIMTISKKADEATSLNFVIADALICHSTHAGAIKFDIKITDQLKQPFYFPDFWLMICGIVMWYFAFMVTMGVNFYLLDLSFKIGFALLALPVCIGLWPFDKFKNKFAVCIKIIINAAGTFMFLGITTGMSILLISAGLGGTDELLRHMQNNDAEYVSQAFGFWSGAFLLVLFAFLYSHKLISETISNLTDKFFSSEMSGLTPLKDKATQMVDKAKKMATSAIGYVANPVAGGLTSMAKKGATNMARGAINAFRGKGGSSGGDGGGSSSIT